MGAYPEVRSEEFVVVVRSVVVADEPNNPVELCAEVGDGPSYEITADTLLEAIGRLATAAAKDAMLDEAIVWNEAIRKDLTEAMEAVGWDPRAWPEILDRLFPEEG